MYVRPVRPPWILLTLATLLIATAAAPFAALAGGNMPPADRQQAPLVLEDTPQPLVPKHPRSEADRDRLEALSLFAAARMLQKRQKFPESLRLYQRAFQSDPEALEVGWTIVSLAIHLKRYSEAVRYVLKVVELDDPDPKLLKRMAAGLTEAGDLADAVKLYEKALAAATSTSSEAASQRETVQLQWEIGRLYFLLGEQAKAAEHLAHVDEALEHPDQFGLNESAKTALLGKPEATYRLFGECFLGADRPDEAKTAFEKAHQAVPNESLLQFHLARIHNKRNESAKALQTLEAAIAAGLKDADLKDADLKDAGLKDEGTAPFELLEQLLGDSGRAEELLPRLETLYGEHPQATPLKFFLAEKYHEKQLFDKAEPLYVELSKEAPTSTGYRKLVEIYRKTDRVDRLLSTLTEAFHATGMLASLGDEIAAITGDAQLMQSLAEMVRQQHQADATKLDYRTPMAVALLSMEGKQFETAAELFDLAVQAEPDEASRTFLVWGARMLLEERPADAAKVFQRALDEKALPEDDPRFHYFLSGALAFDDRFEEALTAARKAVQLKDDSPSFHTRVAWILYRAERHGEAIEAYRQVIERFDGDYSSDDIRDVLRESRIVLSSLYVLQEDQDLAESEEWLQQVLDEFPDDIGALNDLGYLWADQNKHLGRSLKMIQQAIEGEPDNIAYRDSLGWIYFRLGRYPEAVAELQRAVADAGEESPDATIFDHLGDAYLKNNQYNEARDALQRAAEVFRTQQELEKAKLAEEKLKAIPQHPPP